MACGTMKRINLDLVINNFKIMTKLFFYTVLTLAVLFLSQCSNSTQPEEAVVVSTSIIDSNNVKEKPDTIAEASITSDITCPKCGYTKTETLPTEVCQIKYTCQKCHAALYPKDGDCCVFCTYGTHKCPSMQDI